MKVHGQNFCDKCREKWKQDNDSKGGQEKHIKFKYETRKTILQYWECSIGMVDMSKLLLRSKQSKWGEGGCGTDGSLQILE